MRIREDVVGGGGVVLLEMVTFYVHFAVAMIAAAKTISGIFVLHFALQRAPTKQMSNAKKSSKSCKS